MIPAAVVRSCGCACALRAARAQGNPSVDPPAAGRLFGPELSTAALPIKGAALALRVAFGDRPTAGP